MFMEESRVIFDYANQLVYVESDNGKCELTSGIDNVRLFERAYRMGKRHKQQELKTALGVYDG